MNQGDKLLYALHKKGISKAAFARKIGVSPQAISEYKKTKEFRTEILDKILDALEMNFDEFDRLNPSDSEADLINKKDSTEVFFYNSTATMTVTESWPEAEITPAFTAHIPGYDGCIAIQAFGDSMYPTFSSGMWVLCREVSDKETILFGECYLIMTADHLILKRIFKSSAKDFIILASDNKSQLDINTPQFPPIEIHMKKILKMWIVRGSLTKHEI